MMKLIIFLLLTGALPLVLSITRKFYLIQQMKTWSDAQIYCRINHNDLATIDSDTDRIRFQAALASIPSPPNAWTGLYEDLNSWRWSLGDVTLGSFKPWGSSQPNNNPGEACVLYDISGLWWDDQCDHVYNFMCFDATLSGLSRYIYYTTVKSWKDAQTFCRLHHTDLASAIDSTQNSDIVTATTSSNVLSWFGLFRDVWKWSDQTPVNSSTITWDTGLPLLNVNGHCASIYLNKYTNALCTDINPFYCYSEVTGQQQMIRIKLESNQDVEDPAVKAVILGKIQQILKDHGMVVSVSVKLKQNLNGKVFEKIIVQ